MLIRRPVPWRAIPMMIVAVPVVIVMAGSESRARKVVPAIVQSRHHCESVVPSRAHVHSVCFGHAVGVKERAPHARHIGAHKPIVVVVQSAHIPARTANMHIAPAQVALSTRIKVRVDLALHTLRNNTHAGEDVVPYMRALHGEPQRADVYPCSTPVLFGTTVRDGPAHLRAAQDTG